MPNYTKRAGCYVARDADCTRKAAQEAANRAAEAARKAAEDTARAVKKAADDAAEVARKAAEATKKAADDAAAETAKKAKQAAELAERLAKDAIREAEEVARRTKQCLVDLTRVGGELANVRNSIVKDLVKVKDSVVNEIKQLDNTLSDAVRTSVSTAIEATRTIGDKIKAAASKELSKIVAEAKDLVVSAITMAFPILKAIQYAAILNAIRESFAHVLALKSLLLELVGAGSSAEAMMEFVVGRSETFQVDLQSHFAKSFDPFFGGVGAQVANMQTAVAPVRDTVQGVVDYARREVENFNTARENIESMRSFLSDGWKDKIRQVIEGSVTDLVQDFVGLILRKAVI